MNIANNTALYSWRRLITPFLLPAVRNELLKFREQIKCAPLPLSLDDNNST